MTSQEIREHFQWLVDDDTLDEDRELALMNVAYDELNAERIWNYLASEDQTKTIAAGDVTYALATDFLYTVKITLWDNAEAYREFKPVAYRNRLSFKNISGYYYVDIKNSQIVFLCDDDMTTYAGWKLIHDYQYQPEALDAEATVLTTSDTPVFNRAFHPILAYQMAKNYFYNDQGEKSRAWNTEMAGEYATLKQKMVTWDALLDAGISPSAVASDAYALGE